MGGVTRWRLWLDHLLSRCYRGDFESLEPLVREILRIGAYDLAVAGTAPHAAVHEAVETALVLTRPGADKLINAVLRSVDRERDSWESGLKLDKARGLAVRWSHPEWLVKRWIGRFGLEETQQLLEFNNRKPVFSVRISSQRDEFEAFMAEADVSWEPSRWISDFVRVRRLQPIVRGGWLSDGRCAVQDESAGLVIQLLDPQPKDTVVDACAAPGGKTRFIAERIGKGGTVWAVDSSPKRLRLLKGFRSPATVERVASDFREWAEFSPVRADRVLVDVPCTGLGVLSSRADLRWRRSPEEFQKLSGLQKSLLAAGAVVVKPGGLLVYSTCSIAVEENEQKVEAFLSDHPEFELESAAGLVPEQMVTPEGYFATLPHRDQVDGAFGARLRRKGPS